MTKRQVILRYTLAALGAAAATAVLDVVLVTVLHAHWLAWVLDIVFATGLILFTWASFSPNSALFGRVVDGVGVAAPVVAITFDDGPSPDTTPRVLDALARERVRATFFVLGRHAERHPELVERMVRDGHEVANHGYSHGLLTFAGRGRIAEELRRTERVLESAGAPPVRLFRAPHGFRNPFVVRTAQRLGYRVVGWTKGVFDTALPGVEVIVSRAKRALRPGAILLLHDADGNGDGDRSQTAAALPAILDSVRHAGLRPVTVSELARHAPRRSVSWRRLSLVALAVAVVVTIGFERLDRHQLVESLQTFRGLSLPLVVAALLANFLSVVAKATVWKTSLDTIPDVPRFRYGQVVPALFIGFLLNSLLIARIGEVGRIFVLRRRLAKEGVQVSSPTIAGTVLMEQLALGITLALLLFVMALTIEDVPQWAFDSTLALGAAMLALLIGVAALDGFSRARRRRARARGRQDGSDLARSWWRSLLLAVDRLAYSISRGQRVLREPGRFAWSIVAGLASWIAQLVGILWTLDAFGIHHGLAAAGVVFLVSNLVGLFPVIPGNVGVFQIAVAAGLTQAFDDVSFYTAAGFGIGLQVIEVALGVGLGFVFLSLEGLSFGEVRRGISVTESEGRPVRPGPPQVATGPVGARAASRPPSAAAEVIGTPPVERTMVGREASGAGLRRTS